MHSCIIILEREYKRRDRPHHEGCWIGKPKEGTERGDPTVFFSGKDVFVALPTGYGKSYCYALLPLAFDFLRETEHPSIAICVSPLTALMMQQRAKFSVKGVTSEFVGELQQDVDALSGVKK